MRRTALASLGLVFPLLLLSGCQAVKGPHANQPLLLSKQPVDGKPGVAEPTAVASIEPKAPPLPETALASNDRPASIGPPVSPSLRPADPPAVTAVPVNPPDTISSNPDRRAPLTATPAVRTKPDVPAAPAVRSPALGPPAASPAFRSAPPANAPPVNAPAPAGPAFGVAPAVPVAPAPAGPAFGVAPAVPVAPIVPPPGQGIFGHDPDYGWIQGVLDRHYRGHSYVRYCDPTVDDPWGGKVRLEDDPRLAQFKPGDIVRIEGNILPEVETNRTWKHYPRYQVKNIELIQRKN